MPKTSTREFIHTISTPFSLMALTALLAHSGNTFAQENKPMKIESDVQWNARHLEYDKVLLSVLIPATVTHDSIPLDFTIQNHGDHPVSFGETGYLIECKVRLVSERGDEMPYTTHGSHYFDNEAGYVQYAIIKLAPAQARHWQCNLSECFKPLKPGTYQLSLETVITSWDPEEAEFSKPIEFAAKRIPFTVRK